MGQPNARLTSRGSWTRRASTRRSTCAAKVSRSISSTTRRASTSGLRFSQVAINCHSPSAGRAGCWRPQTETRRFLVESTGPAQVTLDEASLPAPESQVMMSGGLHALRVTYSRPEARVPMLRVSWERTPGGPLEPVAGQDLRWQPAPDGAGLSNVLGLVADWAFAALILAWVFKGLFEATRSRRLERAAIGAVPVLFLAYGMLLQAPLMGERRFCRVSTIGSSTKARLATFCSTGR